MEGRHPFVGDQAATEDTRRIVFSGQAPEAHLLWTGVATSRGATKAVLADVLAERTRFSDQTSNLVSRFPNLFSDSLAIGTVIRHRLQLAAKLSQFTTDLVGLVTILLESVAKLVASVEVWAVGLGRDRGRCEKYESRQQCDHGESDRCVGQPCAGIHDRSPGSRREEGQDLLGSG